MKWKAYGLALCLALDAAAAESITIGAEDDWYPYSGLVNGELKGLTVELVREAFSAVGITVKYDVMPYARCMALTREGALVACFDTLRHPGIEADYRWHALPMFHVQYQIYARADSVEHDLRPTDLEGRDVAVTNGYEYGPDFDTNKKILRTFTLRDENNFRMLIAGRVRYTVAMDLNTRALIKKRPGEFAGKFKIVGQVAPAGVYTAFSKRHPAAAQAMERFDQGMAIIRKNGRYKTIEDNWSRRLTQTK
ncbi:transporter substrate-binding domain-containing protein [Chitinimonas arctica]|uniref:Transporter substrate-binding domain-containing protein n=1 Tax=Chitinimonas arctica TaxID=2594795 RepID=A0A516SB98_9NEIS|nr:transporter substrate-binding domain-containing protein [Chitinimonas arctica]QDQ25423.1 transporter substrate-binding domain-containing protein [Chitinimonas arctica]